MTTVESRSSQETDYSRNSKQQHHQNKTNREAESQGKKQTTIASDTNSFPASINRPNEPEKEEAEEEEEEANKKNKGCNSIGGSGESLRNKQQVAERDKLAEGFPGLDCDENSLHRDRLIDSRSILTNKAKLKRYWERKMEMEFKLKQQQHQEQPLSVACQRLENGITKQQLVAIDENNNDQDDERNESSVAFSEEEWRSLSPNVEPKFATSNKLPEQRETNGKSSQEHELICRKLRQYQKEANQPLELVHSGTGSDCITGCEAQLMSLDPTLCHPEKPQEESVARDEVVATDREEQMANEEFSSSNSSFGPISISMPIRQQPNLGGSSSASSVRSDQREDEEEEEEDGQTSTQSGSVLTVINQTPQDSSPTGAPEDGPAADESESNIGVAFESLQFDSEIKSSKEEKVDEGQFLSPVVRKQNGFTKSEVNSVCNLITSAISDATRQVESYMNRKQEDIPKRAKNQNDESTILRATFVESSPQESSLDYAKSVEGVEPEVGRIQSFSGFTNGENWYNQNMEEEEEEEEEGEREEEEAPKADLSSIFEANVRREIQRFESGGGAGCKKSCAGKGTSGSRGNLTEWRIAEEIRLFNERELELKQRHGTSSSNSSKQNSVSNLASNTWSQQTNQQDRKSQPTESVVRFGKTLQIPKAVASDIGNSTESLHFTKGIKLTTTGPQQPANMISMHKFISSGGKRFVFTSGHAPVNNGSSTSNSSLHQNHFTKSMSNLCSLSGTNNSSHTGGKPAIRQVDYKAADSLNSKECPNVRPGITKKVIETFRRLNDVQRNSVDLSAASSKTTVSDTQSYPSGPLKQQQFSQVTPGGFSSASGQQSNSAEFKIQEELREMRAREAELRSQRSHSIGSQSDRAQLENGFQQADRKPPATVSNKQHQADHDTIVAEIVQGQANGNHDQDQQDSASFSYSSESLYPIKQTIDSFRKLNSATAQLGSSRVPTSKRHQQQQQICDYEARVGGERRKISMIEKWENGIGSRG